MRPAGRFVAAVLTRARRADRGRHQRARARPDRARDDPRPARDELLHRLPPLVRRDAVRQGAVRLGQRRGAPRAAARPAAPGRGPGQPRLRRGGRRLGRRLRDHDPGRHATRRGPAPDRDRRAGARRRDRRRAAGQPAGRHLGGGRRRSIRDAGYGVNTEFGGHGVGRTMHGPPHVPNDGRRGPRPRAQARAGDRDRAVVPAGGTDDIVTDPDGWTLRVGGRSRGAHVEHTVAITEDGPLVLTARDAVTTSGGRTPRHLVAN